MLLKIQAKFDFYISSHSRFTVISEALNYDTFFATLSNSAEIFSSFLLANHQGYCNGAQTDPAFPLSATQLVSEQRSPQL